MQKKDPSSEETYEVNASATVEEDDPGPPPPEYISRFKTLQEWLTSICENDSPQIKIETYRFALFEGENDFTLCLTGINNYDVSANHTSARIEYKPKNMYFSLPNSEYKNLTREKLLGKLSSQLKDFVATDKFGRCFLSSAKSIRTDWGGEIWSK